MKFLIIIFMLFSSSLNSFAESIQLPVSQIDKDILGGTVLMIHMKYSLLINGKLEKKILFELGQESKEELYRDIILGQTAERLERVFASKHRPATNSIIHGYKELFEHNKTKLTLN